MLFLIDENLPPTLALRLNQRDPMLTVYVVGMPPAPDAGAPDPDLLIWIEEHDCLLITRNRKSMPVHLKDHLKSGRHVPGIITLPENFSFGRTIEDILLIAVASKPREFQDQILYLPL